MEQPPPKSTPTVSSSSESPPSKSAADQPTSPGELGPTQVAADSSDIPTQSPEDAVTQGGAAKTVGEAPAKTSGKEHKLTQLGEYRLLKVLGSGGMGSVYKARQISLDRDVALKVLSKHLVDNRTFVERFKREARLMAKLDHANILHCYGTGEDHGFHYLAIEYGDAGSMQQ